MMRPSNTAESSANKHLNNSWTRPRTRPCATPTWIAQIILEAGSLGGRSKSPRKPKRRQSSISTTCWSSQSKVAWLGSLNLSSCPPMSYLTTTWVRLLVTRISPPDLHLKQRMKQWWKISQRRCCRDTVRPRAKSKRSLQNWISTRLKINLWRRNQEIWHIHSNKGAAHHKN